MGLAVCIANSSSMCTMSELACMSPTLHLAASSVHGKPMQGSGCAAQPRVGLLAPCSAGQMSLRPRNTATAEQVAGVLKGCLSCLAPEKYLQVDLGLVVEEYVETMRMALKVTQKLIASVVTSAASLAFDVSPEEATAFGQRLLAAFAY